MNDNPYRCGVGSATGNQCQRMTGHPGDCKFPGSPPLSGDKVLEIKTKLEHIFQCAEVWSVTGISRVRAIQRTVKELEELI